MFANSTKANFRARPVALVALAMGVLCTGIFLLSSCGRQLPNEAPPRANDAISIRPKASTIAVPISARLADLAGTLDREVPRELWAIDKPGQTCIASNAVKVLFVKIKTPTIKCRLVGRVTRGRIAIAGSGHTVLVSIPVHAVVQARDIAGVLSRETATADATVQARVQLDMAPDWTPRGTVDLHYRWTAPPTIDFLGQKIDLSEQADAKLKGIIADLEADLPAQLGKLQLRQKLQEAWNAGFTSLQLNRTNPPVWMRVSPKELQYGGYDITNDRIVLRLGLLAITETYVGDRPPDPPRTPLPPLRRLADTSGKLSFFIPVVADYRQLEPVLMRALIKRSSRPFQVPGVGPIYATFNKATIYGSTQGRIAVGLNFSASDRANTIGKARATVWMTAVPVNRPNSRKVAFEQFAVTGSTDRTGGNLVIKLANAPGLADTIAEALTQNFEKDYDKLMSKVGRAIERKREGDFLIRANLEDVRTGSLRAAGRGLYLPVRAQGTASITLAPATGR